jgi:predicted secreted protein
MTDGREVPRRDVLRMAAGAWLAPLLAPLLPAAAAAAAAPPPDDDTPTEAAAAVLRARFGTRPLVRQWVQLDAPDDAPDGRVVPLFIEAALPAMYDGWVRAAHIVVDHNPDIYLAGFAFDAPPGATTIDTRIKMRRTSWVRAILETSRGELYYASRKIFVTMNGCV